MQWKFLPLHLVFIRTLILILILALQPLCTTMVFFLVLSSQNDVTGANPTTPNSPQINVENTAAVSATAGLLCSLEPQNRSMSWSSIQIGHVRMRILFLV
jgi:hypothetical protein